MLALLLLLSGCDAPRDLPRLVDASASCDEADGSWRLTAQVQHDRGPEVVQSVFVDASILLVAGDFVDSQYIGSHALQREDGARWGLDLLASETALRCGFADDYALTFTAEDDQGDQAAAAIRIDGLGNRVP